LPDSLFEDLEDIKKEKFAYLTTAGRKTGRPHQVELWFSIAGERIFLSHEGHSTDWMKNISHNKSVSIRIGRLKLEADARLLSDGELNELGKGSLYEKYYGPAPKATIDDWFELSTILELKPIKYSS
jgi:deazaflavin-dependent oxidoreductase (nitroreductase family)